MARLGFVAALALAALAAAPSAAAAQDPMAIHLSPYLGLGFGGELDVDGVGSADLDATVGFGLKVDLPLHDLVAVGARFAMGFWKIDGADQRDMWVDLPVGLVRVRYPFELGRGLLEPFVEFDIGGTISVIGDDEKNTAYGWNVGVLFGAHYFFSDFLGVLFEIGWLRHAAEHDWELPFIGTVTADGAMNQAAMNLGVSFLF